MASAESRFIGLAAAFSLTLCALAQPAWSNPGSGTDSPIQVEPGLDRLLDLMQERLSWMRQVAAWKWQKQVPIEDPQRERELLERLNARTTDLGFEEDSIERIFKLHFDMAMSIQRYWYERWQLSGFPEDFEPQDLQTVIRPKLASLLDQMLTTIYLHVQDLREPAEGRLPNLHRLNELPLDPLLVIQLERAFKGISLLPLDKVGLLKRIRTSGLLRVGMTGDYPPFSSWNGGRWQGIDVELAQVFARALRARVAIVPTSWKTLSDDLRNGKFDIAMSGITTTSQRSASGYFSDIYYQGGKQLFGRCSDRGVLTSLRRIDTEGVKVLVNGGGSNEEYIRKHIRNATILIHTDRRALAARLENNLADVVVADAASVQWYSRQHPLLCALSDKFLSKSRKAYLTQKDKEFVGEVDVWLERIRRSGELNRTIEKHLFPSPP